MDKEYYLALVKVRMDRAKELLAEAEELLIKEAYKSANNRAFYAIEKSIKALLATKEIEVMTHNGGLLYCQQRRNTATGRKCGVSCKENRRLHTQRMLIKI